MSDVNLKYNYVFQPYSPSNSRYPNIYSVSGPDCFGAQIPRMDGIPKSTAYLHARRLNEVHGRVNEESEYFKKVFNELFPEYNNEKLTSEQEILQALARGYCHDKNASKILDADLIQAMAEEVMQVISNPNKCEDVTSDQVLPLLHLTKQIKDHVENYSQDMQIKIYGPILHYCLKMYSELEILNNFIMNLNERSNDAKL